MHMAVMPRFWSKNRVMTQPETARKAPIPATQVMAVRSLAWFRLTTATTSPATSMTRPSQTPQRRIRSPQEQGGDGAGGVEALYDKEVALSGEAQKEDVEDPVQGWFSICCRSALF